jgi:hypothetical protein
VNEAGPRPCECASNEFEGRWFLECSLTTEYPANGSFSDPQIETRSVSE